MINNHKKFTRSRIDHFQMYAVDVEECENIWNSQKTLSAAAGSENFLTISVIPLVYATQNINSLLSSDKN